MSLAIGKAGPSDPPAVARLNGVVQDLHAKLSPDIFRADWKHSDLEEVWCERLKDENSTVVVARLNGAMVG
jgi:hypothetical protein